MFNLNDSRWGRSDDKSEQPGKPEPAGPEAEQPPPPPPNPTSGNRRPSQNAGPPDLDELWRDLNRKLGNLFGGGSGR
jgi:modulator of FtsH protease HflK